MQVLFRERRELEQLVRVDVRFDRMVDHVESQPIEVGHLAQLLGDLHLVDTRVLDELLPGHENEFVVVRRHHHPGRHRQPKGRDAEHVGDELVGLAVPGVEEGARSTEVRRLVELPEGRARIVDQLIAGERDVELREYASVRVGDAQHVERLRSSATHPDRLTPVVHPPVHRPRAHLDDRAQPALVRLVAAHDDGHRVAALAGRLQELHAPGGDAHEVRLRVAVRVEHDLARRRALRALQHRQRLHLEAGG